MEELDCRRRVAEVARKIYARGMVNANEGNVSARLGERVYITPSQVCKEALREEELSVTDLSGRQLAGALRPSSELLLHLEAYRLREDVGGVVHVHSPFATAFAIARKPIESRGYTEMIYFYDKIPVAAYGAPGTPDIARELGRWLKESDVVLLANHGLLAVGETVAAAFQRAEAVEAMAKTLLFARLLGGEAPLTEEELEQLYRMRRDKLGRGKLEL